MNLHKIHKSSQRGRKQSRDNRHLLLLPSSICSVLGRMMPPPLKDVHVLIPEVCDYVTLHGKRNLAAMIKPRFFKWEDYPGLSKLAECNHRILIEGRKEGQS